MFREVWPDEEFGSNTMTTEEEVESLRLLLFNPSSGMCLFCGPLPFSTVYWGFFVAMSVVRTLDNEDDCNEDGEYGQDHLLP